MDFLNKAALQITDLFKTMTPTARITSGLLLVGIIVSMFYLFQYQMNGGEVYLYGAREFSSEEIGQMESAFGNAGLNGWEVVGSRIQVPLSERDQYLKALSDNSAIPYSIQRDGDEDSIASPFMSGVQVQLQEKRRKTDRMEHTIASRPNIASAVVSWDEFKEKAPFTSIRRTCSVTVKTTGSYRLTGDDYRAIAKIVSGSLAGIKDEDIFIIDQNGGDSWSGDKIAATEQESELARARKEAEEDYRRKIRSALSHYHGHTVQVDVSLDPISQTSIWSKKVDPGTTIRTTSEKENNSSTSGGNGGAPGVRSNNNVSANGTATLAATRQSSSDLQRETTEQIAGGTLTNQTKAGFEILQVEASIGIPQDFVERYYLKMNPPADDTTETAIDQTKLAAFFEKDIRQKIAKIVQPLLPAPQAAESPYDSIVIEMLPSIDMDPLPGPDYATTALTWLAANWQNLGLMGFGLFAVVMLRSMVGSAVKDISTAETVDREFGHLLPDEDYDGDEIEEVIIDEDGRKRIVKKKRVDTEEEMEEKANQLLERFQNREPTLRDELIELVEADLDSAAEVLRSWIGEPV